ncbi:unnamed protein product [Prunus armeniaca]
MTSNLGRQSIQIGEVVGESSNSAFELLSCWTSSSALFQARSKSKVVDEAVDRVRIWQSTELDLDESGEAIDQLMQDLDLLHRQNVAPRPILEISLGLARDVLNLHNRYEDLKPSFKASEFCKATHEANLAD